MSGLAAIAFMATLAAPLATPEASGWGFRPVAHAGALPGVRIASPPPTAPRPLGVRRDRGSVRSGLGGRTAELHGRRGRAGVAGHLGEPGGLVLLWGRSSVRSWATLRGFARRPPPACADSCTAAVRRCAAARAAAPDMMLFGGIGGGAIGVPLLGMAGAYGLAGRRVWARVACGALFLAGVTLGWSSPTMSAGPGSPSTPHGGSGRACSISACWPPWRLAASIPLRASEEPRESNAFSGKARSHHE